MNGVEALMSTGLLVMARISGMLLFAPVLSSSAIPPRIKAAFVMATTALVTPGLVRGVGEFRMTALLGEVAAGLLFGLCLMLLTEAVLFASTLLGMQFSFSLVNLIDPVSKVETPVLGQALGWMTTLVLLGAGLHRTMLAALLRTFDAVPPGAFVMSASSAPRLCHLASGMFFAGLQLAAPVMAAALMVEATVALMGRIAPQLPTTVLSVPVKTMVCYGVLMGSLALWPRFLERYFDTLLRAACELLLGK